MKKYRMLAILSVGLALAVAPAVYADSFTFGTLPPSGAITGTPGSTVGWGYTITNQSANYWLMVTGLSADVFLYGTPNSFVFDFPILAPGATLTVPYDPLGPFGLFEFTWDPTAPIGFTNTGTFTVSAEFWTDDPFAGGAFFDSAADQSAAYSVTVVPEPSTFLLLATGLAGLALRKKR